MEPQTKPVNITRIFSFWVSVKLLLSMKKNSDSCTHSENEPFFAATRRQDNYNLVVSEQTRPQNNHSLKLPSPISQNTLPPILASFFVSFLLLLSSFGPVSSHTLPHNHTHRISDILSKINKPPLKTIKSPDGDLIDCVLFHEQPAFDHPELKGQRPLDPPERPRGYSNIAETVEGSFQLWRDSGDSCPDGSVPIRRTREEDILRSSSVQRFGRRPRNVRRDSTASGHEVSVIKFSRFIEVQGPQFLLQKFSVMESPTLKHAVVFVNGDQFYGAKASINVWAPRVTNQNEFSLSQIWVIAGSFRNDLNTIEAGWQVSPELYGDNKPRFFTYWTADAYEATGCYNLLCSGFVQTNNKVAIGAAVSPTSVSNGRQFDIGLMIWKDPKHGHWWLELGSGELVGYWPANLFNHLRSHASMVQFGGEIVNTGSRDYHTSTQMGSGQFAEGGYRKAAYFRNLQVVDWDNSLLPLTNIHQLADHSNCYDIRLGMNNVWGTYFYYGGPGRNVRCP